jgi:uncharacterized protein (TIGR00299 family) protein
MKVAYLDCFSGISGDMFLGALVDAGLPFAELERLIASLKMAGCRLEARKEGRNGIYGTRILVHIEQSSQPPRDFDGIRALLSRAALPEEVKTGSIEVFSSLAAVEGKIHNVSPESVHFHEVGAADSIVDIVGSVYGLFSLHIHSVYASRIPLGSGFVQTAHGTIPIPVPATMALLQDIPVCQTEIPHEMVTPTGAALVKTFSRSFGPLPPMTIEKVGYGVGSRELPGRPNLFRLVVGKKADGDAVETIVVLESNIDDMNPEWAGFLMERLFTAGALDVVFHPIQMKKNRPGIQIQILGRPDAKDRLLNILFQESGTLGVRFAYTERQIVQREAVEIESPWGKIRAKKSIRNGEIVYLTPEYESCRELARARGVPLREIYSWVTGQNSAKEAPVPTPSVER